jgi:hypothetical protein
MTAPTLYYIEQDSGKGKIVAVAPKALREEDRLPNWQAMRIAEDELRMFLDGSQSTDDWFVHLDQDTMVRRLLRQGQVVHRSYSNLNHLNEAFIDLNDPDLIIDSDEDRIYLRYTDKVPLGDRRGRAMFWLTYEQNPVGLIASRQIDMGFDERRLLFIHDQSCLTTIYTNARFQRILDNRYARRD